MYPQKYPDVDQVVMVQVKSIAEMGAYVQLLEYENIEGMILLSELTRRRIRSVSKLIKVGRIEPAMVLRVDEDKGYIDLSKRRVSPEDVQSCETNFNKSKVVHSIIRHVSETTGTSPESIYKTIGWPLYKKYGHAFDAFKLFVSNPGLLEEEIKNARATSEEVCDVVDSAVAHALLKDIRRRMTPQPLKIRADVELTCFAYDGILHIQNAMRAAELVSTDQCKVKMSLVASPLYVLTSQTSDKDEGIAVIDRAVSVLQVLLHF
jgi:translation initiation factor 2 subunit 1